MTRDEVGFFDYLVYLFRLFTLLTFYVASFYSVYQLIIWLSSFDDEAEDRHVQAAHAGAGDVEDPARPDAKKDKMPTPKPDTPTLPPAPTPDKMPNSKPDSSTLLPTPDTPKSNPAPTLPPTLDTSKTPHHLPRTSRSRTRDAAASDDVLPPVTRYFGVEADCESGG